MGYDRVATATDIDFIGLTIGRKIVAMDGKKTELFAMVCRNSHELEWMSDFNLGKEEDQMVHLGFDLASKRAFCALMTYYDSLCG